MFKAYFVFLNFLMLAPHIVADEDSSEQPVSTPPTESSEQTPEKKVPEDDGFLDPIVYSAQEKKSACKKYEGKYIAYYESIYHVEKCKFREIQSSELILKLNKSGAKIVDVEGDVLAKLERGPAIEEDTIKKQVARTCKQLEKRYVTFGYTDVYYVEGCKKHLFPEWSSFIEHRKKRNRENEQMLALTWIEFNALRMGSPMTSMMDGEYSKQKIMGRNVDVIALDEACKGLNGKDVSYVDRIYRIEKCRKRSYDPETFLRSSRGANVKLKELSSEQWLSLPEGKPMATKK